MSDRNLGSPVTGPQSNLPPLTTTPSAVQFGDAVTGTGSAPMGHGPGVDGDSRKGGGLNAPRIIGLLALIGLVALFVWLLANRGDDSVDVDDSQSTELIAEDADAAMTDDDAEATNGDSDASMDDDDDAMGSAGDDDGAADSMDDADDAMEDADDAMAESSGEVGSTMDTMLANPELSIVADGIGQLGLDDALSGEGPFTILAPTNGAFLLVDQDEAARLLGVEDNASTVLSYHVLQGEFSAENFVAALEAQGGSLTIDSLTGEEISVELVDGQVVLNGNSVVIEPDQPATNGVVHTISELLVPPSLDNQ